MIPRARPGLLLLLAAALPLAGCGMLGGGDKGKDGESIGYACRVSSKLPEDCMKENETYPPTSILDGWKAADKDVKDRKIDPLMGKSQPAPEAKGAASKADSESKPEADKAATEMKPGVEMKPATEEQAKH